MADFHFDSHRNMNQKPLSNQSNVKKFGKGKSGSKNKRSNNNFDASNASTSSVRLEYEFPLKTIFLIRQTNLLQKLRNDGLKVSFVFTASDSDNKDKLIVLTTAEFKEDISNELQQLPTVIDHCDGIAERICQYLAHQSEKRDFFNRKLQELHIEAGITYIDQSISVIAFHSDHHCKAIAILQEVFDTSSAKMTIEDLHFPQNMKNFLSLVKKSIPQSNDVWLEDDFESDTLTCILTATGPRNKVATVMESIYDKQKDFKVINYIIKDICPLKTEYLRLYLKDDILALEQQYFCKIELPTIHESETFSLKFSKPIQIKCCRSYKDVITGQIQKIMDSIIIEKEDSISQYSRIGRTYHCSKSKSKLQHCQKEFQCMLKVTSHQSNRY